jgi:hypothetical protein
MYHIQSLFPHKMTHHTKYYFQATQKFHPLWCITLEFSFPVKCRIASNNISLQHITLSKIFLSCDILHCTKYCFCAIGILLLHGVSHPFLFTCDRGCIAHDLKKGVTEIVSHMIGRRVWHRVYCTQR